MTAPVHRFDHGTLPEGWRAEVRCDVGRLRKAARTPAGGVRVPGAIARVGVLEYRGDDGSMIREFVPEETLSDVEAMRSLRDAPVTVGHPGGGTRMVTPDTYKTDSVGHVSGEPRREAAHLVAELVVQDGEAIRRIDGAELEEISAGYSVWIDPTPGTFEGQHYDQVQRARKYNHVALLPRGGGRAGESVALRLDGRDVPRLALDASPPARPAPAPARSAAPVMRMDSMETERIDGVSYQVGSREWRDALERKLRADMEGELEEAKDAKEKADMSLEEMTAERDALKAKVEELDAQITEMSSEEEMDARADARATLITAARGVLGADFKPVRADAADPSKQVRLKDREIREAVLTKLHPELKLDGRDDSYVTARFDAEIALRADGADPAPKPAPSSMFTPAPTNGPGAHRADSAHTTGRRPPRDLTSRCKRG